ncbi:plasmid mobilization protein [Mycobacterium heckeshornense]|uniref:plasmid mobilization protein n=1 Tax=Mycobacterium heckeshornense TaxID=110505 RepID=UPI000AB7FF04
MTEASGSGRKRSERRQRTALIALRVLPRERDQLYEAARARGVSVSELIRASVLAEIKSDVMTASQPRSSDD